MNPFFAYVALILSFGYMTQMGLSPFLLAFPVLLWALTEWLVLLDKAAAAAVHWPRRAVLRRSGRYFFSSMPML